MVKGPRDVPSGTGEVMHLRLPRGGGDRLRSLAKQDG